MPLVRPLAIALAALGTALFLLAVAAAAAPAADLSSRLEGHYEYHPGDRYRRAGRDADPRRADRDRRLQSAFVVSSGDRVQQGEVIGYSGCTGYCLGPHVHFEVRINGEVTDPLGYL